MNWELIVGLEIHAQLMTRTKAFCRCANRYGEPPNTLTCPTCLGLPGALPVLNRDVVRQAAKLALALNATIHPRSKFDRKNYFYPDLPKGYQISQYDEPFSTSGYLDIVTDAGSKRIQITRAHIEEDAGKSLHLPDGSTIVDMNRCGVPLVEIVSEPDFRTSSEAGAYVAAMRELLRHIGVCDGNMERGSLRCDVNISVRPDGQVAFNERTEIKNLNSIRSIERAIEVEKLRQIEAYSKGETIHRETLLWDEQSEELRPMRRKEGADDYRYFPEPDLVELHVSGDYIANIRAQMPELPWERRRRYRDVLKLHEEAVSVLASDRALGDYFEEILNAGVDPRAAANWIQGEIRRYLIENGRTIDDFPVHPSALAEIIAVVQNGTLSMTKAKEVFRKMIVSGQTAAQIIESEGLIQTDDTEMLRAAIAALIERYSEEAAKYRSGKKNLFGFFMGEAMKATNGTANPKVLNRLLQEMLQA